MAIRPVYAGKRYFTSSPSFHRTGCDKSHVLRQKRARNVSGCGRHEYLQCSYGSSTDAPNHDRRARADRVPGPNQMRQMTLIDLVEREGLVSLVPLP